MRLLTIITCRGDAQSGPSGISSVNTWRGSAYDFSNRISRKMTKLALILTSLHRITISLMHRVPHLHFPAAGSVAGLLDQWSQLLKASAELYFLPPLCGSFFLFSKLCYCDIKWCIEKNWLPVSEPARVSSLLASPPGGSKWCFSQLSPALTQRPSHGRPSSFILFSKMQGGLPLSSEMLPAE